MLPEAADLAQNRPLWRMMLTYGATQSWNCMPETTIDNVGKKFCACILLFTIPVYILTIGAMWEGAGGGIFLLLGSRDPHSKILKCRYKMVQSEAILGTVCD